MKDNLRTDFQTRQYMTSDDFELFYYSDNNLTSVNLHKHDYYEFYFFIEGDVRIQIENDIHTMKHGDFIIIPPNKYHKPFIRSNEKSYRRFVFWVSKKYVDSLISTYKEYNYMIDFVNENKMYLFSNDRITFNTLQSKIIKILDENRNNRFGKSAQLSLYVDDLLINLNKIIYNKNNTKKVCSISIFDRITEYIEENLESDLSLDKLSEVFFVSKYHISHTFKENIGISIHQYITKKRLVLSRNYILSGLSINESYQLSGFGDYSSFYRAFKKEYGISPNDFKKQNTVLKINSDWK